MYLLYTIIRVKVSNLCLPNNNLCTFYAFELSASILLHAHIEDSEYWHSKWKIMDTKRSKPTLL